MQMKKTLLLALGSLFLQTAVSFAQPPSFAPPMPAATPGPVILDQGPPSPSSMPMATWLGSSAAAACPRVWGSTEALMWWTKNAHVTTPLVTSALSNTDPTAGQAGSANTSVLLGGNQQLGMGTRYGGRLTLGGWFDCDATIGMEANYLFITPRSTMRTAGSDGSTTIGLPFFNVNSGSQAFQPISTPATTPIPGILTIPAAIGGAFLRESNRLQGGELNGVARLLRYDTWSLDGLAGFRYINFDENLDFGVNNFFPGTPPVPVPVVGIRGPFTIPSFPSTSAGTLDSFHATNVFYGGQLGLRGEYRLGNFFVEGTGKLALGTMNEHMSIAGSSFASTPGNVPAATFITNQGGFYAQPTNIGNHNRSVFCAAPEAELKFGYNVSRNVQVFAAYNFLYLSNVERPGTAIDHNINPSIVPVISGSALSPTGVPAPNFSFSRSDFWAQGINFGIAFKF
jgi:hypothetical protein